MNKELTNEQIAAGAAVKGDNGKPVGRNAAIEVFDAMSAATNKATEEGDRSMFEDWARRTHRRPGTHFNVARDGTYMDNRVAAKWAAWKAAIAADRASRQVANKAEVEPVAEWVNYEQGFQYLVKAPLPDGTKLYATPPATTGASTARDQALEEAARVCDEIESDLFDAYKGRGKYEPMNPRRADTDVQGQSDGAGQCGTAIRKLKASVGASTVLTDERIDAILASVGPTAGAYSDSRELSMDKIRKFAREVAAQAGQVAVPGKFSNLKFVVDEYVKEDSKESDWSNEKLHRLQREITQEAHPRLLQELLSMIAAAPSPAKESK